MLWKTSFGFIWEIINFLKICKSWVWEQIRRSQLLIWGWIIKWLGTYFSNRNFSINQFWNRLFSFSLLYWISNFLWIYSQISSNSWNVVFSIIILKNLRKSLWIMRNQNNNNNCKQDYLFSMVKLAFIFSTCS